MAVHSLQSESHATVCYLTITSMQMTDSGGQHVRCEPILPDADAAQSLEAEHGMARVSPVSASTRLR